MGHEQPILAINDWEVQNALKKLGLTTDIVKSVAEAAAGGRAEASPVDPYGTPGTLSYIYGVREIRLKLLPLGWKESRLGNVESTVNHELGVQLWFQNVDSACNSNPEHYPRAISAKGTVSKNLINYGQQDDIFEFPIKHFEPQNSEFGKAPIVWLICVSVDEELSIKAEVSRPKLFEGNQFEGFHDRIFVVNESINPLPSKNQDKDDGNDFDVYVSKK